MLISTRGAPERYTPETVMVASQLGFDTYVPWRWGSCSLGLEHTTVEMYDRARCLPFTPGKRHYLLLGDSHAAHLWPGFSTVFSDREVGQANVAGCNLLPDKQTDSLPTCRNMADLIYNQLLPSGEVDTLIASAQWHAYDIPAIGRLVAYARRTNIKLVLIGPSVAYDLPLPRLLANLSVEGGDPASVQAHSTQDIMELDGQIKALARDAWHVPYISFFDDVCSVGAECPAYASAGVPMLLDSNHFTPTGAVLFAQAIRDRGQIP